jgi:hypothetical protein
LTWPSKSMSRKTVGPPSAVSHPLPWLIHAHSLRPPRDPSTPSDCPQRRTPATEGVGRPERSGMRWAPDACGSSRMLAYGPFQAGGIPKSDRPDPGCPTGSVPCRPRRGTAEPTGRIGLPVPPAARANPTLLALRPRPSERPARDVPILLSIVFSSCHWCHVMERESFQDEEVARQLARGSFPSR